jgi:hypothetical protein
MLPPRIIRAKRPDAKRCPAHRAWVRSHRCCVPGCYGMPVEAAHVRRGTDGGVGLKPGDAWCISLCRDHHTEQHTIGEATFEERHGIDMKALAEAFAKASPHRGKLG